MSLTLIIWCALFAGLVIAAIRKSAFAISLYMLTFFLSPPFWWWGDALAGYRWNLYGGIILLIAALMLKSPVFVGRGKTFIYVTIALFANMTFVHFAIAGGSEVSFDSYELVVKFLVLTYLMIRTVRTVDDLKIAMISILLGAAYIGFECMVNDRGDIVGNRLEGVGAPGATTANHFASLMVTILPLVAPFFLLGRIWIKGLMICLAPLIVNVVLLCNSRGAFLAAISSAVVFLTMAPREIRSKAIVLVAFGSFGVFMLMGDARIMERFLTTFSSAEERDSSAQSRLDFWKAGANLVSDYPAGAGGHGFKKVHGIKYLRKAGVSDIARAVHNGYINEACQWGVQGLILRLFWYYLAIRITISSIRSRIQSGTRNEFVVISQIAMLAGISAFLIGSLFGDLLDAEWGHWLVALMVAASMIGGVAKYDEIVDVESESPTGSASAV